MKPRVHYMPRIYLYIYVHVLSWSWIECNAWCTDTESEATLSRHGGRHVQTSLAFPFPPRVASRAYALRGEESGRERKRRRGGRGKDYVSQIGITRCERVDTEPGVHAVFPEKCLQVLPAYLMRLCALRFEPSGSVTGNLLPKEIITSGLGACRLELWVLLLTKYRNTATFHHSSSPLPVSLLRFRVSFRNHEFLHDGGSIVHRCDSRFVRWTRRIRTISLICRYVDVHLYKLVFEKNRISLKVIESAR